MRRTALLLSTAIAGAALVRGLAAATTPVEDAAARAALPEFKVIPAAPTAELTPALPVDAKQFRGWPRSQGDNGARRY
ncbi:MAG: hypothetical protein ACKODK_03825, partial [Opitutaceae bacterium]